MCHLLIPIQNYFNLYLSKCLVVIWRWPASYLNTLNYSCPLSLCSALEHFKRWLIPEKVAISAEELEYLLRPSQNKESAESDQMQNGEDAEAEMQKPDEDDAHKPEK